MLIDSLSQLLYEVVTGLKAQPTFDVQWCYVVTLHLRTYAVPDAWVVGNLHSLPQLDSLCYLCTVSVLNFLCLWQIKGEVMDVDHLTL